MRKFVETTKFLPEFFDKEVEEAHIINESLQLRGLKWNDTFNSEIKSFNTHLQTKRAIPK